MMLDSITTINGNGPETLKPATNRIIKKEKLLHSFLGKGLERPLKTAACSHLAVDLLPPLLTRASLLPP